MATSGQQWNATEVLKIKDSFTCVGHAPSKGRKCQNPIAAANRQWASEILKRIESRDVMTINIKQDLEELAPRILCKRNHQNQATTMVNRWLGEVENFKTERRQQGSEPATLPQRSSQPAPMRAWPSRIEASTTSISPTIQARVPARLTAQPVQAPVQQRQTPPTTPTRRIFVPIPTANPAPTPQVESSPAVSAPVTTPPAISPLAATPPAATPPATATPNEPSPAPTSTQHHHQEPTPPTLSLEECSICYEDILTGTGIASSCDHSFHASCINTWLSIQDSESRARICPYCRADWSRKKVEGECSICRDGLLPGHENGDNDEDGNVDGGNEGELVWCKSRCGQNFHRECMSAWLAVSETGGSTGTCPNCRAEWVPS